MAVDRRSILTLPAALAACATPAIAPQSETTLLIDLDRQPDEDIPLWPGTPPGGEGVTLRERIVERTNPFGLVDRAAHEVTRPIIQRFNAQNPDGSALLIIPGGGYSWVVIEKEGYEGARWFSRRGITTYVLRHRLPHQGWAAGADTPLQDAQRAVRVIRARAAQDGINPARLTVMGFSAGGHVAGSVATRFNARVYEPIDADDELSARPDLSALMYPVITMRAPHAHPGSRRNLLGENPTDARVAAYSLEAAPPADTPPTFIMHAADDPAVPVENTLNYSAALRAARVPTEMHIFERGGHGFGLRGLDQNSARTWPELFLNWRRMREGA
ncbi:alpha/beta hydrolase [Terricaulis silvestris]|uniref:Acetylxylan esterase n=1 Tax=Terricaulis silvestris TaxID=2686094 RepID=A0A6I6MSS9_9CAUL|nr:alpha/beta hydrolase [Terricaulis silvestris]QGZ95634.1 Acetylxylan esterase precursor [Terricaulis silvestris]